MDSKTVNLNFLTLGELENEPISKKSGVFLLNMRRLSSNEIHAKMVQNSSKHVHRF